MKVVASRLTRKAQGAVPLRYELAVGQSLPSLGLSGVHYRGHCNSRRRIADLAIRTPSKDALHWVVRLGNTWSEGRASFIGRNLRASGHLRGSSVLI